MPLKSKCAYSLLPLCVLFFFISTSAAQDLTPQLSFLKNGVTAHRGNSHEFPENSIQAFESAMELGVDWLELDIFRTADGKLVVLHDQQTGRVADRDLNVLVSTYDELKQLDFATQFRRERGLSLNEVPAIQLPLLEDVLQRVMRQSKTRVSIQPKMLCVPDAITLIQRLGASPWCGFNDGKLELMAEVKKLSPATPVFWDRPPGSNIESDIQIALDEGFESLVLHHSLITGENVNKIHAAGLEVGAWTVNELVMLHRLKQLGVDRIYTDRPRDLLALQSFNRLNELRCEGRYPKHLQGVCLGTNETIYWSFTTELVKSDFSGRVLKKISVADHHGDLCFVDGQILVAVNLGKFNDPAGNADNWIFRYDAETLAEINRTPIPEVKHGAGGIAYHAGKFIVVGGLAPDINENYLYEYDRNFQFQKRHTLPSGYTLMGIQTAAFAHERWWFGCYGNPQSLITTDANFGDLKRVTFNASLGICGIDSNRLVVATGSCEPNVGCDGELQIVLTEELLSAPSSLPIKQ